MATIRKSKSNSRGSQNLEGWEQKQKKSFSMKGFFSGLLDLAKCRYISEAVSDHELDFISVMETRKQDMPNKNLSRFCSGAD